MIEENVNEHNAQSPKFVIFSDIAKGQKKDRLITIISLCCMLIVSSVAVYYIYMTNESHKNQFYVLDSGQTLATVRIKDYREAVDIICEGTVKNFHELFFAVEPDLSFIKRNIEDKALYLIDKSGTRLYNQLIDEKYFEEIAYRNYSIDVEIDSVNVSYDSYPYMFKLYGQQRIYKDGESYYRNLTTKGYLRQVAKSPNNLNGIMIEKFKVIDNTDIIR